jgi:hypothetical protein
MITAFFNLSSCVTCVTLKAPHSAVGTRHHGQSVGAKLLHPSLMTHVRCNSIFASMSHRRCQVEYQQAVLRVKGGLWCLGMVLQNTLVEERAVLPDYRTQERSSIMIRHSPDESQEPVIVPAAPPAEEPIVAPGPAPESSAVVIEAAPAAPPEAKAKPKAKAKAKPKAKAKAKSKAGK